MAHNIVGKKRLRPSEQGNSSPSDAQWNPRIGQVDNFAE